MNLLLMGAPGAGKGTVSSHLIEVHGMKHISTGDILREAVANKTELGLKVKEFMDTGTLVPDSIILEIIKETLKKIDSSKGVIFDGFPRTINQAKEFDKMLKEINSKIDLVIALDVADDVVIKRITGRRTCSKCKAIYNIYYKPSRVDGKCDECGGDLYTRNDDNLDSLKKRLSEYHINAEPLLSFYESKGIVKHLNADTNPKDEYEALEEILKGIK